MKANETEERWNINFIYRKKYYTNKMCIGLYIPHINCLPKKLKFSNNEVFSMLPALINPHNADAWDQ